MRFLIIQVKKLVSIFLLLAILFFSFYPLSSLAKDQTEQAILEDLDNKLAEMISAISLIQKQIEDLKSELSSFSYVRKLDKDMILENIEQGKQFLFRSENETEHGFYKKYDALNDNFGERLHTVYSASIIYTFLYLNDWKEDEEILKKLPEWGDFLLSMQNKEQSKRSYGAFYYSYYLNTHKKEERFPVGTSALSIFTLLRLHEITGEQKYLDSAKMAGDWLLTMQREDGVMKPYGRYAEGIWRMGKRESLLYNGQVLSALSKLYGATNIQTYYDTAEKIAKHFSEEYEKEQGYIQGDYRIKNPISNSWVVMSLLDFYKVSNEKYYKDIIYELSNIILKKQITDIADLTGHGRWKGAYSTSGIGWISEVMSEMYIFCKEEERDDCEKYKDSVVRGIRWIIQNTYSKENSYFLKNPEMAIGGIFWNTQYKYVRTDSVCHALNAYTRIIEFLKEEILISI